jgi:hypothetical protein
LLDQEAPNPNIPKGLSWYQNSCAYDAALTVLHAIWTDDPKHWTHIFKTINEPLLGKLAQDFGKHKANSLQLETARDNLRQRLAQLSQEQFKWGELTSIHHLVQTLLTTTAITIDSTLDCMQNHNSHEEKQEANNCYMVSGIASSAISISEWIKDWKEETQHPCATCGQPMTLRYQFRHPWPIMAFDLAWKKTKIDHQFSLSVNGARKQYQLRGIIYFGNNHFTSRIISHTGQTWFHDGMETGKSVIDEGDIQYIKVLNMCQGKQASLAIYINTP